jgi:hypothetical protein
MLPWTKNLRILAMNSEDNNISITFGPTSSLQSTHLAPTHNAAMDNDGHQRHVEKQISLDLMNGEKITLPI